MADDIHNISMLLGDIRGSLRALESKTDTNNTRAETAIGKMLSKLEDQDDRLDRLAADSRLMRGQLDSVISTANDSKLVTDDVKRWRVMGAGALALVGIGAAWLGANGMWVLDTGLGWLKARLGL